MNYHTVKLFPSCSVHKEAMKFYISDFISPLNSHICTLSSFHLVTLCLYIIFLLPNKKTFNFASSFYPYGPAGR